MKRWTALALCVLILITSLTACGTPVPDPSPSPSTSEEPMVEYDWDAAYAAYSPDTVVMTVNGQDVTWSEYFYWYNTLYVSRANGNALDTELDDSDGMTLGEFLKLNTEGYCIQYHVIDMQAEANSAVLTDEDQAVLDEQLKSDIEEYGGEEGTEEALYEYLAGLYITPELYNYINRMTVLYPRLFVTLYGAVGEKMSDEDTMAFAEDYGFMTAKHILFRTTDDSGNALSDGEIASKRAQAEDVLAELNAVPESEREALFDELMNEYSEDPGLENYPNGYCFEPGTMVQEFEDAVTALEPGGISDIVESSSGYHIIMREPVTPEDSVMLGTAQVYTLRYAAAVMAFNEQFNEWITSAELVYTDEFADFNMGDILKVIE